MKRKVLLLLFALCVSAFSANAQFTVVSITGEAVGGWGDGHDFDLTSSDGVNWSGNITTAAATSPTGVEGGIKFRADHAWTNNWGSLAFPDGTGTPGGANIQCTAGNWDVTFNSTTGEYHFITGGVITIVKLTGTASPGGDLTMSTLDGQIYTLSNTTLVDGTAQFNFDGASYGGSGFPVGTADDTTLSIPVTAGQYNNITYNIGNGDYTFTLAPENPSIAIVGSATAFGWPAGTPGEVDAGVLTSADGETYMGDFLLTATAPNNVLKFRQENAWTNSWGGVSFPTGPTPGSEGSDIIVTAPGLYHVVFTRSTGAYAFSFNTIAIVGAGVGGWPTGAPGEIDANQLTTTDGENYTLSGLAAVGGEAKFRQNNAWTLAWGGTAFPSGTGDTAGGSPNIPVPAGTYDVTFNRTSGAYNFAPLATTSFNASNFKVYPNPTQNEWNFASAKESIQTIQIVDVLGKTVMTINPENTTVNVDASALNAGIYFAKIATATSNTTVKVVKN